MDKRSMLYLENMKDELFSSLGDYTADDFEDYRMNHSSAKAYESLMKNNLPVVLDFLEKKPKQRLAKKYYQEHKEHWLFLLFLADVALERTQELLQIVDSFLFCDFSCQHADLVQRLLRLDKIFYDSQRAFLDRPAEASK